MNHRLPSLKGKEVVKILVRFGFVEKRTTGSHVILKNATTGKIIVVPVHGNKDVKRGTLFAIIKEAGLTLEEFLF